MSNVVSEFVSVSRGDNIAVISLKRPESGQLGATLRQAFLSAIEEAQSDDAVAAIVLASPPNGLNLDLPHPERINPAEAPSLAALTQAIAESPKPVVAALRGRVADAGLELALAAHARLALADARLSLPTFSYGQLPTPQALYTLARQLGPKTTLDILSAKIDFALSAPALRPLLAQTVTGNAVGNAADLARALVQNAAPPQQPAFDDPLSYQAAIEQARGSSHALRGTPEYKAAIECLEAALLLPPVAAIPFFAERTEALSQMPDVRNKAYVHSAKLSLMRRPASEMPQALTIVGTGLQARKLALTSLRAGLPVKLLAHNSPPVAEAVADIARALDARVKQGTLPAASMQTQLQNISDIGTLGALERSDLVVEAAAKSVAEMGDLARDIRTAMGEHGVLLLLSGMRNGAARFSHLLGGRTAGAVFHPDMGLGEWTELMLKPADFEAPEVRAPLISAAARLGLPAILQRAMDGSAATRITTRLMAAAEECAARGADPAEIDAALGYSFKPFAAQNAEGFRAQSLRLASFYGDEAAAPSLGLTLIKAGMAGSAETSAIDAETGHLTAKAQSALAIWRDQLNLKQTRPDVANIQAWAEAALYCAAADLLLSGAVATPWEADFAVAATLGLPRAAHAPLFAANAQGLLALKHQLEQLEPLRPVLIHPPSDMDERIKNGLRYAIPGEVAMF